MTRTATAALAAATMLAAGAASAQGLDRSGQNIGIIFEEGDYAELSLGYVAPTLDGRDDNPLLPFENQTGDVADNYFNGSIGYKQQITDAFSFALIADQPYGANIAYAPTGAPGTEGSLAFGGTRATLDSSSLTAMGRYEFGNGFSVHGGVRAQQFNADIALNGVAYGGLNGYSAQLDGDTGYGFQLGGAYERPDIALRVALTYFSEIDHDVDVVENLPAALLAGLAANGVVLPPSVPSQIEVTTPEAINLDFQTGIAPDTLLFGGIRHVMYSDVVVSPTVFDIAVDPATPNSTIVGIDDSTTFRLGVGRRFNDKFSGLVSLSYTERGDDDLVSPLAPSDGSIGLTLGGAYNVNERVTISGGINYTKVGDARPETGTPDVPFASFDDNSAVGVGVRVGVRF